MANDMKKIGIPAAVLTLLCGSAFAQSTAQPVVTGYLSSSCPSGQTVCFVQYGSGGGGSGGTVTQGPQGSGGAGEAWWTQGIETAGAALTGGGTRMMGSDGTNSRDILTDSSGHLLGIFTIGAPLGTQTLAASVAVTDLSLQSGGALLNAVQAAIPPGTNIIGYTSADPCAQAAKLTANFESTSSGGNLITGTAAKITYICSLRVTVSTLTNFSLCEATSTACSGGTPAAVYLNTGTTAANGGALGQSATVGGGLVDNGGGTTIAKTATTGQNVDVLFATTNSPQVNVQATYVQQ